MVVQNNLPALNANNQLRANILGSNKATEKLSSGYRINRAGDDAAGLAISEKMRGQIRGLAQAQRNAQDGISLIQTAEGGAQEIHNILQRMRELAVQSANGTYEDNDNSLSASAVEGAGSPNGSASKGETSIDRYAIQDEVNALAAEIDRIAFSTKFNNKSLINGALENATDSFISKNGTSYARASGSDLIFQVGANGNKFERITLNIDALDTTGLFGRGDFVSDGLALSNSSTKVYTDTEFNMSSLTVKINTQSAAQAVLSAIDFAINKVSINRGKLGAAQNRLEYTVSNLTAQHENLTAAESRIRDTDMAKTTLDFTKYNILQQAAQAMLAQANQAPQGVLQLLR